MAFETELDELFGAAVAPTATAPLPPGDSYLPTPEPAVIGTTTVQLPPPIAAPEMGLPAEERPAPGNFDQELDALFSGEATSRAPQFQEELSELFGPPLEPVVEPEAPAPEPGFLPKLIDWAKELAVEFQKPVTKAGKRVVTSVVEDVSDLPRDVAALLRGIAARVPEVSTSIFTWPVRVLSGAGAVYNAVQQGAAPDVAMGEFAAGYAGDRDVLGASAKAWDESAGEAAEIIRGQAKTEREQRQHEIANQMWTALFVTYGGAAAIRVFTDPAIRAGIGIAAQNVINKAKNSIKVVKQMKPTGAEYHNVKNALQFGKHRGIVPLTKRETALFDAIKSDSKILNDGLLYRAVEEGGYKPVVADIVNPWQRVGAYKPSLLKPDISKAPGATRVPAQVPSPGAGTMVPTTRAAPMPPVRPGAPPPPVPPAIAREVATQRAAPAKAPLGLPGPAPAPVAPPPAAPPATLVPAPKIKPWEKGYVADPEGPRTVSNPTVYGQIANSRSEFARDVVFELNNNGVETVPITKGMDGVRQTDTELILRLPPRQTPKQKEIARLVLEKYGGTIDETSAWGDRLHIPLPKKTPPAKKPAAGPTRLRLDDYLPDQEVDRIRLLRPNDLRREMEEQFPGQTFDEYKTTGELMEAYANEMQAQVEQMQPPAPAEFPAKPMPPDKPVLNLTLLDADHMGHDEEYKRALARFHFASGLLQDAWKAWGKKNQNQYFAIAKGEKLRDAQGNRIGRSRKVQDWLNDKAEAYSIAREWEHETQSGEVSGEKSDLIEALDAAGLSQRQWLHDDIANLMQEGAGKREAGAIEAKMKRDWQKKRAKAERDAELYAEFGIAEEEEYDLAKKEYEKKAAEYEKRFPTPPEPTEEYIRQLWGDTQPPQSEIDREQSASILLKQAEANPKEFVRKRGFSSVVGAIGLEGQVKVTADVDAAAARVQARLNKQRMDLKKKYSITPKKIFNAAMANIVDINFPIKRDLMQNSLGQKAVNSLVLSRGSSAEAVVQYDLAEANIAKHVPHKAEDLFCDLLQAIRTIEVEKVSAERAERAERIAQDQMDIFGESVPVRIKSPFTGEDAKTFIDAAKKQHPELYANLEKGMDGLWGEFRSQLKQAYEGDLLTQKGYEWLRDNHAYFFPRLFLHHMDPGTSGFTAGGRKISVPSSGLERLEEGSEESLVNNWRMLLGQYIVRTQGRIFQNRANRALYDYAKADPKNAVGITIQKPIGLVKKGPKTGMPIYGEPPTGMTQVTTMIKGVPHHMLMPDEMARHWVTSEPVLSQGLASFLRVVSGSSLTKMLATGLNPAFAVSNMPRDLVHASFVTTEWSPILPIAWAQQIKDLVAVKDDVFGNKGLLRESIRHGLGMNFLTTQGSMFGKKPWESVGPTAERLRDMDKALGWIGEKSEMWTRVALVHRALKNGKTMDEAVGIARSYIDFAQGGSWTKAADTAIPYLGAGVQGTRGIFRAFAEHPVTATFKTAQIMAMSAGLAYVNNRVNKDCWDSISKREKESKWCITTPLYDIDEDGCKRHYYLVIPKDQGQRVFAAIGEALMMRHAGGGWKESFDHVKMAATDFMPVDAYSFFSPTMSAFLGYVYNKDFWRNEDIWKGGAVAPKNEYWNSTPKQWVLFGKKTGLSPMRSEAAFNAMVPKHPLVWLAGGAIKEAMGGLGEEARLGYNKHLLEGLTGLPFVRRVLRRTYPKRGEVMDLETEAYKAGVEIVDSRGRPRIPEDVERDIAKVKAGQADYRHLNSLELRWRLNQIKFDESKMDEIWPFIEAMSSKHGRGEGERLRNIARQTIREVLRAKEQKQKTNADRR